MNRVVPELIGKGHYTRPSLGIEINEELNQTLTEKLGVAGVLILRVTPGSNAEAAGLQGTQVSRNGDILLGDVITAIGGRKIDSVKALMARLDDFQLGDRTTISLWRDGRIRQIEIAL